MLKNDLLLLHFSLSLRYYSFVLLLLLITAHLSLTYSLDRFKYFQILIF